MTSPSPILLWFRRDLRLDDHPALQAALATGRPVLPVFVLDDSGTGLRPPGGAARWWLHGSLEALDAALRQRGSRLILCRGDTPAVLARVAGEAGADTVHCSRAYTAQAAMQERAVRRALEAGGATLRRFAGGLLFEPAGIAGASGKPYRVFTPFWRACQAAPEPKPPQSAPDRLPAPARWPAGEVLSDWSLRPTVPDWAGGLREHWQPGEAGAVAQMAGFLDARLAGYGEGRDRPDQPATSGLSPHLAHGELSPRRLWHACRGHDGAEPFLRQLAWREFCHHLLHHWPDSAEQPFQPAYAAFPWREDDEGLRRWQRGLTGYPLVDAGMRQLWHTGWMHNRVRMVAASFLVKHLLLHWRHGEAWFWDTLVDADEANNAAGWQWVAGSGADAAPFFRIFNPVAQGRRFDKDGAYIRRWLPELAGLPDRHLHEPWSAPADVLRQAGVSLGESFPAPMVEHAGARQRALAAFQAMRRGESG